MTLDSEKHTRDDVQVAGKEEAQDSDSIVDSEILNQGGAPIETFSPLGYEASQDLSSASHPRSF